MPSPCESNRLRGRAPWHVGPNCVRRSTQVAYIILLGPFGVQCLSVHSQCSLCYFNFRHFVARWCLTRSLTEGTVKSSAKD